MALVHWWWHNRIVNELTRLHSLGYAAYTVQGLASNLGLRATDVASYVDELVGDGTLLYAAPLWDYTDGTWVQLTVIPGGEK